MKKYLISIMLFIVILPLFNFNVVNKIVYADDFTDIISNEINNLDLDEFQNFLGEIEEESLFNNFYKMLKGEYSVDFSSVFEYVLRQFFSYFYNALPDFFLIIAIILLNAVITSSKGNMFNDEILNVLSFVFVTSVLGILIKDVFILFNETKNTLKNLTKLIEIMSPIILTLMVAQGESVSASLFRPSVIFATNTFVTVISSVIIPLVFLFLTFSILNSFSCKIKFGTFSESVQSIIKWIIGLISTIFGLFITVQSIAGTSFDSVSIKISKYILSSSVPLIGGMVKDGLSLISYGSLFIKNAVGITGIIAIFYIIIKPILLNIAFSLVIKLTSSFSEIYGENQVGIMLKSFSKAISYLNICLIISGICFFILMLLTVLSSGFYL